MSGKSKKNLKTKDLFARNFIRNTIKEKPLCDTNGVVWGSSKNKK